MQHQGWTWQQQEEPHAECWPEPRQGSNTLALATANVTAWNSFLGSDLINDIRVGTWCMPEHKLTTRQQVSKARKWLKVRDDNSFWGKARTTEKGHPSSGAAVLWAQGLGTTLPEGFKGDSIGIQLGFNKDAIGK